MKINSRRLEGRLFADRGHLCLVLEIDPVSATGRVSCRLDGRHQIVEMPLAEICRRVASTADLKLDNLDGSARSTRIMQEVDGWFFLTREGRKGPYRTRSAAEHGLRQHVLGTRNGTAVAPTAGSAPATPPRVDQ